METKLENPRAYIHFCLTVIAVSLVYLCCFLTIRSTQVSIAGFEREALSTVPIMPSKPDSKGETIIPVRLVQIAPEIRADFGGQLTKPNASRREVMEVKIVDVASDLNAPIPVKIMEKKPGFAGKPSWTDEHTGVPVRLVGIERPQGFGGPWHAIPVRAPSVITGELGGLIGAYPIEVKPVR